MTCGVYFFLRETRGKKWRLCRDSFCGGKSPGRVLPPSTSSGGKDARTCMLVLLLAFASSI